jgi:predicted nuclease of predicted toxin-antitoxin system
LRFLVDAQLPPGLADYLREVGHEADHVNRIGLGASADREIWAHACHIGAALITKDADFLGLACGKEPNAPVVWVRLGNVSNANLRHVFMAALPELVAALNAGERIVELR